uniref:Uncharacterized protein n=1 Tax=Plectus sambesii TaxID=2011161 RepID=A0A914VAF9_9BILA
MGSPYYDHQQQFNMGPHSAPPVQKQHMPSFSYPPMGQERFMSGPSTSGQTTAPPSYYAAARPPLNRTNSGQPRVQPVMGPPVPRKQLICVFSSELGNKAADDVRGQRIGSIIQWHHANVAPHASAQLRQQQQMLGASSLKRERPLSPLASSAPPSGAIPQQQRPPSRKTPQPRTPKTPSSVKQPTTPSGEATPANGQPPATSSSLPSTPVGAGSLCSSIDGVLSTSVDLSLSED